LIFHFRNENALNLLKILSILYDVSPPRLINYGYADGVLYGSRTSQDITF
jgi:hypothetical protein